MSAPHNAPPLIAANSTGKTQLTIHPMVVLNISEHFTRARAQAGHAERVIGAILGTQEGSKADLSNSFELAFESKPNGDITFNFVLFQAKIEGYKKNFPKLEVLGWYSSSIALVDNDVDVCMQLAEQKICENPLVLLLNPFPRPDQRDLPISVYETEVHVVDDKPVIQFVPISYQIQSQEAERIGVEHIAQISRTGDSATRTSMDNLSRLADAVKMLDIRIDSLVKYLTDVQSGKVPLDQVVLRQLASLCNHLPVLSTPMFEADFLKEYNDILLTTYLAGMTKGSTVLNQVLDKFNFAYDSHRRGGYSFI